MHHNASDDNMQPNVSNPNSPWQSTVSKASLVQKVHSKVPLSQTAYTIGHEKICLTRAEMLSNRCLNKYRNRSTAKHTANSTYKYTHTNTK